MVKFSLGEKSLEVYEISNGSIGVMRFVALRISLITGSLLIAKGMLRATD